jgi:hypothetical protein
VASTFFLEVSGGVDVFSRGFPAVVFHRDPNDSQSLSCSGLDLHVLFADQ